KSALEAAAIAIAQSGLLQFVEDLARRLAAAIRQLADTNPALLRMATVLAAVLAAAGPVLTVLGIMSTAIAAISAPIAIAIGVLAALAAIVAHVANNWDKFGPMVMPVIDDFKAAILEIGRLFDDNAQTIGQALDAIKRAIATTLSGVAQTLISGVQNMIATLRIIIAFMNGEWRLAFELGKGIVERWAEDI